jgi:hypothetical protein
MLADPFPQFYETEAVGIVGVPFPDRFFSCFADALRGREIRFTDLEMDDVAPLSFQSLRSSM